MVALTSAALLGTKSGARFLCGPQNHWSSGGRGINRSFPIIQRQTGKPLQPPVAESIGHQPFVAESTALVLCRVIVNTLKNRQPTCRAQRHKVLSLVTFFGPVKKATRLPAGTGDLALPTPQENQHQSTLRGCCASCNHAGNSCQARRMDWRSPSESGWCCSNNCQKRSEWLSSTV